MEPIKTFTIYQYTVNLYPDELENPRESDTNLGTMVCFHRRYRLGDKHDFRHPDELGAFLKRKDVFGMPLYLLDHSGLRISTTDFKDPWDSGQVGVIYTTNERVREYFGKKRITKSMNEAITHALKLEVQTYDDYLSGSGVRYEIVNEHGEVVDECGGFYSEDEAENEAHSTVTYRKLLYPDGEPVTEPTDPAQLVLSFEAPHTVIDYNGRMLFQSTSDKEFIDFVRGLVAEDVVEDYSVLCVSDAKEYIEDYRDDLQLK